MKFKISAGHRKQVGSGANGLVNEVTECRKIVAKVVSMLKETGYDATAIYDNTTTTQSENLDYLVKQHNAGGWNSYDKNKLNVFIHLNCYNKKAHGTECYYYNTDSTGKAYAQKVVNELAKVGYTSRGAKAQTYYVLKKTYCPAILIETFFCDSSIDVAIYKKKFDATCNAIYKALTGKDYKKPVQKPRKMIRVYWFNDNSASFQKLEKFVKDNKWNYDVIPEKK